LNILSSYDSTHNDFQFIEINFVFTKTFQIEVSELNDKDTSLYLFFVYDLLVLRNLVLLILPLKYSRLYKQQGVKNFISRIQVILNDCADIYNFLEVAKELVCAFRCKDGA